MPAAQTCEQAKARVYETQKDFVLLSKQFLICLGFNMTLLKKDKAQQQQKCKKKKSSQWKCKGMLH